MGSKRESVAPSTVEQEGRSKMVIATQTPGRQWVVASESRPNTLYIVKLVNGLFSCDCRGNYSHGHCKHAKAVAATQPEPTPPAVAAVDPTKIEMAQALGIMARPRRAA